DLGPGEHGSAVRMVRDRDGRRLRALGPRRQHVRAERQSLQPPQDPTVGARREGGGDVAAVDVRADGRGRHLGRDDDLHQRVAAHAAATVVVPPPPSAAIDWSAPTTTPSTRNRTAMFAAPPAPMFAITAPSVSGSPPVTLFGETLGDETVRSGRGAIGCDTG